MTKKFVKSFKVDSSTVANVRKKTKRGKNVGEAHILLKRYNTNKPKPQDISGVFDISFEFFLLSQ